MLALALTACSRDAGNEAPPRQNLVAPVPQSESLLAVPVIVSLDALQAGLNAKVPGTLVSINKVVKACVPAKRLTICLKKNETGPGCAIGFEKAKITPDIPCRIMGEVNRGPIALSGRGDVLRLSMPVSGSVRASDARNKIGGKTATAAAEVRADLKLSLGPNWTPIAKVEVDYNWTKEPGLKLLGNEITFAHRADPQVEKLIAKLEAEIPALLAEVHTREALADLWRQGFTTVELNRKNPQAWLRIAPASLHVDPWNIEGRSMALPITVRATAETFIGRRPADPVPTPLPSPSPSMAETGFTMSLPVTADYAALEPVLAKALGKLSKKGIPVGNYGRVAVQFGKVTIYPTYGGRIAVGLEIDARSPGEQITARGTIWLTATPVTTPGSLKVGFEDLTIAGRTDNEAFGLLAAIAELPEVNAAIASELTQDFSRDYRKLFAKIEPKLAALPIGKSIMLDAKISSVRTGKVSVLGQGLFMPVEAQGSARLILKGERILKAKPAS